MTDKEFVMAVHPNAMVKYYRIDNSYRTIYMICEDNDVKKWLSGWNDDEAWAWHQARQLVNQRIYLKLTS